MKADTTPLVVELLFGGALLETGLLLLLDDKIPGGLAGLLGSTDLAGSLFVASLAVVAAYYLGSILNLLSERALKPLERWQRKRTLDLSAEEARRGRVAVFSHSANLGELLDFGYSQIRIFRGSLFGFLLLGVSICLWQPPGTLVDLSHWLAGLSFVLAIASLFCLVAKLKSYFKTLKTSIEHVAARPDAKPDATAPEKRVREV